MLIFPLCADYSPWTFFGGLNLIYNADDDDISEVPGMNPDGTPGGLSSAPSPLPAFIGFNYAFTLTPLVSITPSFSIWTSQYAFAKDRALPVEIENRTAYVPSIFIDVPVFFTFNKKSFDWYGGLGPAILCRWGFLEMGIPKDAINLGETLTAYEQVEACNTYFWSSLRWFYPTVHAGVRYKLETGWGGGFSLRIGLPIFNLWSSPKVAFQDHLMILAALTITPPAKNAVSK